MKEGFEGWIGAFLQILGWRIIQAKEIACEDTKCFWNIFVLQLCELPPKVMVSSLTAQHGWSPECLEGGGMCREMWPEEDRVGSYAVAFFKGTRLSLVPHDPRALSYSVFSRYVNSQIKPFKPSVLAVLIKREDIKGGGDIKRLPSTTESEVDSWMCWTRRESGTLSIKDSAFESQLFLFGPRREQVVGGFKRSLDKTWYENNYFPLQKWCWIGWEGKRNGAFHIL